jgi:CBS domain-containing protein
VVDDDAAMRDSLDFLLGTAGFDVRLFDSAQAFLDELAKLEARLVGEAMTSPAVTIGPERPITAAASLMLDHAVNRLPVVDPDGRLLGIVTRADLVRAFARADAEVAQDIRTDVVQHAMWLGPEVVEVQVDDGEVTLRGHIEEQRDAELLPRLAMRVPGVVGVHSELTWSDEETR